MSIPFAFVVQHTSLEPRLLPKEVISSVNLSLSSKHVPYIQTVSCLNSVLTWTKFFASFPQPRYNPSTINLFNLLSIPLDWTIS